MRAFGELVQRSLIWIINVDITQELLPVPPMLQICVSMRKNEIGEESCVQYDFSVTNTKW